MAMMNRQESQLLARVEFEIHHREQDSNAADSRTEGPMQKIWDSNSHFGQCGQNCGCCRFRNRETYGACSACAFTFTHGSILVRQSLIHMSRGPFNLMGVRTATTHLSLHCNMEIYTKIMQYLDDSSLRWRRIRYICEDAIEAFLVYSVLSTEAT